MFVTLTPTNALTMNGSPGFTLVPPASIGTHGVNFYCQIQSSYSQLTVGPASSTAAGVGIAATAAAETQVILPAQQPAYFVFVDSGPARFLTTLSAPLVIGSASTAVVSVTAYDGMDAAIQGPFANPITITSSDGSGRTSLSGTAITATTPSLALKYTGQGDQFSLTAAIGSVTSTQWFDSTLPQETLITPEPLSYMRGIIAGPDGNLWTATGSGAASITPAGQYVSFVDPSPHRVSGNYNIVVGSDGNLWTDYYNSYDETAGISRMTPAGVFTDFEFTGVLQRSSSQVGQMVLGPDGAIWFTLTSPDYGEPGIGIGRIDMSGSIAQIAQTATQPANLVVGSDGNLWFTLGSNVEKMTPGGTLTAYTLPGSNNANAPGLRFIVGPDGNFWAPFAYGTQTLLKFNTNGSAVSTTALSYSPEWDLAEELGSPAIPLMNQIVTDASGNVYLTDANTQGLIRITSSGTEVAYPTYSTITNIIDDPLGIAVGSDGNVYLASTAVLSSMQSGLVPAITKINPMSL